MKIKIYLIFASIVAVLALVFLYNNPQRDPFGTVEELDKYGSEALRRVPFTKDESEEVVKYRKDLANWLEADDECMGMMPGTEPKDPRTIKK